MGKSTLSACNVDVDHAKNFVISECADSIFWDVGKGSCEAFITVICTIDEADPDARDGITGFPETAFKAKEFLQHQSSKIPRSK